MDEIYTYIGKILQAFQHLESILSLIDIYSENIKNGLSVKDCNDKILEKFYDLDSKTMGQKLKIIEQNFVFEKEQDVLILTYIKDKRNYIVHSFFIDNDFETDKSIDTIKKELQELFQNIEIIKRALAKFAINLSNK